jgi:hypothetical protein
MGAAAISQMARGPSPLEARVQMSRSDITLVPAARLVKHWEIIADNLSKAGWSWGCVSAVDAQGRTIWIADAHRGEGQRFVVNADEKLTAFMELESVIRGCGFLA